MVEQLIFCYRDQTVYSVHFFELDALFGSCLPSGWQGPLGFGFLV